MKSDFYAARPPRDRAKEGVAEFFFIFLLFVWNALWLFIVGFALWASGKEVIAAILLGPRREMIIDPASIFQYYLSVWCYGSVILGVWALLVRPR